MRRVLVALVVGFGVVLVGFGPLSAASGASATVADAIALVHASRGTTDLGERSDLDAVAQRHAERMAAENRLYHNPSLGREVTGYELVGENVGVGPELGPIHQAFMESPSHRANILDTRFTEIGIGLATGADGALWIVQVFRQPIVVAAAPAPAPAPAAAPAPAPAPAAAPAAAPAPVAAPAAPVAPVAVEAATPAPVAAPAASAAPPAPAVDVAADVVGSLRESFVWPKVDLRSDLGLQIDVRSENGGRAVPMQTAVGATIVLLFVGSRTVRAAKTLGVIAPRLAVATA